MKDIIHWTLHCGKLGHIMPKKAESFFTSQMVKIPFVARQQIVHGKNFMAFLEESIDEMGAEESRPPSDNAYWHILELETKCPKGKPTDSPPSDDSGTISGWSRFQTPRAGLLATTSLNENWGKGVWERCISPKITA
jgi:hypothetical protein